MLRRSHEMSLTGASWIGISRTSVIWLLTSLSYAASGCGPSTSDFLGTYNISTDEAITACDREGALPTALDGLGSATITNGIDSDLVVKLGDCSLRASMTGDPDTRFHVASQTCTFSIDEVVATIKVSGDGDVIDDALNLTLSGTYATTNFGYPVNCSYSIAFTPRS